MMGGFFLSRSWQGDFFLFIVDGKGFFSFYFSWHWDFFIFDCAWQGSFFLFIVDGSAGFSGFLSFLLLMAGDGRIA